ncbi:MAG: hypothetical protein HFH03_07345 [Dorea sp.]|jgi:glucan-binding YG repeat protein|nr:hypothetical protein [Dorea sp.]
MSKRGLAVVPGKVKHLCMRRGIAYGFFILLFCGMLIFTAGDVKAAEGKETGKEISGKIVKEKGNQYYKYANGKKAKSKFITVGKKTYYFAKNGVMEKGWMKKGKEYYYFDRITGVQKKKTTVDGIKINKDGKAKKTAYNEKKIAVMITAKNIVKKNTKVTDSKAQKRKKMFEWVIKTPYRRYRILSRVRKKKGWEMDFANDIFKKGRGCCVSDACAFAFLAHECGYTTYVCDDGGHAWTEINGRVFDTLFAERRNRREYKKYYNSSYKAARLHRAHKLKI